MRMSILRYRAQVARLRLMLSELRRVFFDSLSLLRGQYHPAEVVIAHPNVFALQIELRYTSVGGALYPVETRGVKIRSMIKVLPPKRRFNHTVSAHVVTIKIVKRDNCPNAEK